MEVPLLDINAQNAPLQQEFEEAFQRVFASGCFILGPEVEAFEREIAEYVGAEYAIGISSGTDALLAALMALEIGPGDEVIIPAFTFFATAGCVARTGATPVFVDVCPASFNINVAKAAEKITPKTKAIIPVHLYGQSAEMDGIMALAEAHGLKVIEDAAQSIGATYRGKGCGSIGHFGAFSFYPTKNLGALGDAGMLVTSDPDLAARARILRNHGMDPKYYHNHIGGNFRLDALQAAFLRSKLKHLDTYAGARASNAGAYIGALGALDGISQADESDCCCPGPHGEKFHDPGIRIILPVACGHCDHVWNQFTVRVIDGSRDELKAFLESRGIGSEIYYPLSLDQQVCFSSLSAGKPPSEITVSQALADECLSLPVYPELAGQKREKIILQIREFLEF